MENLQMQSWIVNIDTTMLPEPYRRLVELLGLEVVLKLADEFQGTNIYFPKLDGALKKIRDKQLIDDYQAGSSSIKELARKYGLTETWVRAILAENNLDTNQMNLFEIFG